MTCPNCGSTDYHEVDVVNSELFKPRMFLLNAGFCVDCKTLQEHYEEDKHDGG